MKIHLLAAAFMLTCSVQSQNAAAKKIDSLLSYYHSKNQFMGSVALSENGKEVFNKAYGFETVENMQNASIGTLYKIGSITKMYTSVMVFQLVEEGKLTLDTKLSKFYPTIVNADKITIGQMLSHRSGIFNYTDDPQFGSFVKIAQNRQMMIDKIKAYTSDFEPGSKGSYSNSNYLLLGYIIEDLTRKSYEKNLDERISSKAGLKSTFYGDGKPKTNEAYSYKFEGGRWISEEQWHMSLAGAAGAIVATSSDVNKFTTALFNGKLLSKSSFDKMVQIQDDYGHGIFEIPFYDKKAYGHTGGIEEFRSMTAYFPTEKLALTICANARGENNNDLAIGILSFYFNKPYSIPNLDKLRIDPKILANYEGTYSAPGFPLKLTIRQDDGFLIAQATNQPSFPLDAKSERLFFFNPAGLEIEFSTNKLVLRQGGGIFELNKE